MADTALGVQSQCCGTFSTVAGSYSDEQLNGTCGRCQKAISAPNPSYVAPAAPYKWVSARVQNADGSVGKVFVEGTDFHATFEGLILAPEPAAPPSEPVGIEPDSEVAPEATVVSEGPASVKVSGGK